jgi:hypothetical protein
MGSVDLDAERRQDLAVTLDLAGDVGRELARRLADDVAAIVAGIGLEALLVRGLLQAGVELLDDRGGQLRRPPEPRPAGDIGLDAEFGEGRHVGELRHAPGAGDAQHPQLAGLQVGHDQRRRDEEAVDGARDRILDGGGLVRDVRELNAGAAAEELAHDMGRVADAGGAVVELAGLGLRRRDELLQRPEARIAGHHQAEALAARHQHDRREALDRVVGQPAHQHGVRRVAARRVEDRVAIGLRARHLERADGRAAARLGVHDHGAAVGGAIGLGKDPHRVVGARARAERHDDAQAFLGRPRGAGGQGSRAGERGATGEAHQARPWMASMTPPSVREASPARAALRHATWPSGRTSTAPASSSP